MLSTFVDGKFLWGVSIDNMWVYAGLPPPKSIIIPHLLNVRLPQGPYSPRITTDSSSGKMASDAGSGEDERSKQLLCRTLAKQVRLSRVDFVRCWFQWNLFQAEVVPGKKQDYNFPLDAFVQAFNDEGIEILAVIGNGYYRFLPKRLNINKSPEYVSRLSAASREIVRHYRGKISMWQIENEPNWWLEHFSTDWRRGGVWFDENIAETILSELQRIVKEEDPRAPAMINLEADTARVFFKRYAKYCDVLGLDFYPNYSHAEPINVSEIKLAAEVKKVTGLPVMIAETGYPSGPKLFGYDEQRQSQYIKAVCEQAYSLDALTGLGVWRLTDTYWYSFPFQENNFGLLTRTGMPKSGWFEYVDQIRKART